MKKKTPEAQLRATRKWEAKNKEKVRIDAYRRSARSFIRKHATEENLKEFEILIEERRKKLEEIKNTL